MKIMDVKGREILDSRGNPTVEVDVYLEDGTMGRAAADASGNQCNVFVINIQFCKVSLIKMHPQILVRVHFSNILVYFAQIHKKSFCCFAQSYKVSLTASDNSVILHSEARSKA